MFVLNQNADRGPGECGFLSTGRGLVGHTDDLELLHLAPNPTSASSCAPQGGKWETHRALQEGWLLLPPSTQKPLRVGAAGPPLSPHSPLAESFRVCPHCGRSRIVNPISTPRALSPQSQLGRPPHRCCLPASLAHRTSLDPLCPGS